MAKYLDPIFDPTDRTVEINTLELLLEKRCNKVYAHLKSLEISSKLYSVAWLYTVFCQTFTPMETVFRIW
jgi:hypothetical protein